MTTSPSRTWPSPIQLTAITLLIFLIASPLIYLLLLDQLAFRKAQQHWPASEGYTLKESGSKWEFTKGDATGWPYKRNYYQVTSKNQSYDISVTIDIFLTAVMWKEY